MIKYIYSTGEYVYMQPKVPKVPKVPNVYFTIAF